MTNPTTSWMWLANGAVCGLRIDPDTGHMEWFDEPGCHCEDSAYDQTLSQFLAEGAPPIMGDLPAPVASEVAETVAALQRGLAG